MQRARRHTYWEFALAPVFCRSQLLYDQLCFFIPNQVNWGTSDTDLPKHVKVDSFRVRRHSTRAGLFPFEFSSRASDGVEWCGCWGSGQISAVEIGLCYTKIGAFAASLRRLGIQPLVGSLRNLLRHHNLVLGFDIE